MPLLTQKEINAYTKVSQKLEDNDISFIELGKNKDNELKSITMDYERLKKKFQVGIWDTRMVAILFEGISDENF